ncbi:MAG: hypothetical protein B7Y80_18815 [Hyphomicrobium sp. 32-62-53]|nr:MAG: hypothetical protein B7Z29_17500 [Hyphomicrobium sp. 12-62-95]OYX97672.1 MAG: hypothetical protein B7Y80_18815 [Hyphomicrobium sp. 32-62-53]
MVTSPVGWSKGIGFDAMTCEAKTPVGSRMGRSIRFAAFALSAALLAGCSSATIGNPGNPSYLGAHDLTPPAPAAASPAVGTMPRVTSSKVLSAVVFERVTGLEVDPARLIDR